VFTGVIFPLKEAVFTMKIKRKLHFDGMHPVRSGTDHVLSRRPGFHACDERQDVTVETIWRRVATGVPDWVTFDGTDSELEISTVSSGQLDDDRNHVTATISTSYDARCIATSDLVIARYWRVPRISAHSAFTAVHRPLSLNITATSRGRTRSTLSTYVGGTS